MKFTCEGGKLSDAVNSAARVAAAKSPRQILRNIALIATKTSFEVLATDLEVGLRLKFEGADVVEEGRTLVNAARFSAVLKELNREVVEVRANKNGGCTVKAKGCSFNIFGEEFSQYPNVDRFNVDGAVELAAHDFRDLIKKTQFAAATEKTRFAMNGVFLQIKDGVLRSVATDAKRLALLDRPITNKSINVSGVIPVKAVNTVDQLLEPSQEKLYVNFLKSQVCFKSGDAEITARLVDGQYPPYETVIPKSFSKTIEINRNEFQKVLRRASLLTTKESHTVKFHFGNNRLTLATRTIDIGESEVFLDIKYDDEPVDIAFNPEFIAEALKITDNHKIDFCFNDSLGATLIKEKLEKSDKRPSLTYIAMPINLDS